LLEEETKKSKSAHQKATKSHKSRDLIFDFFPFNPFAVLWVKMTQNPDFFFRISKNPQFFQHFLKRNISIDSATKVL